MEVREGLMRERRLYNVSLSGNVELLNELMREDRLVLARDSVTSFSETPLHIAAMQGHVEFAKALLYYKPDLVFSIDLQGRSPLHCAAANGYVEIVKLLLLEELDVYLARDECGRTPLHLAVMKGQVKVVNVLVRSRPELTLYTLDQGETIFHTCVIYNRLEALKLLVEWSSIDDFVNAKDANGNTILHTATILKQKEIMKYLLSRTGVGVNEMNGNGFTALDIIESTPRDLKSTEMHELVALLVRAGALRAKKLCELGHGNPQIIRDNGISQPEAVLSRGSRPSPERKNRMNYWLKKKSIWLKKKRNAITRRLKKKHTWVEKKRDSLMVAATVIAALAYQAGLNPPSGVWQDDKLIIGARNKLVTHGAGTSIMAAYYPDQYCDFWKYNTVSFVASISIILVLVSGLPLHRRILMWLLMAAMWVTMTFMALTYLISMQVITPESWSQASKSEKRVIISMVYKSVYTWLGVIGIVFMVHTCRLIMWITTKFMPKYTNRNVSSWSAEEGEDQGVYNV